MMKVSDAKQHARQWVHDIGSQEIGYVGSFMAGSINRMADNALWKPLSDVDIFTLVDRKIDGWSEQQKFLYQGVIVESVVFPLERFEKSEQVLSRVDAINLTTSSIIADPRGYLTKLAHTISREYTMDRWTRRRCMKSRDGILSEYLLGMLDAESLPAKVFDLLEAVMQMAQLPALAQNQNPTVRQCLLASHHHFTELGHPALHESLLTLLGSAEIDEPTAMRHLRMCAQSFDYATTIIRTPFWGDFDVNQDMRPIGIDGGRELIERGYPREAIWWILFIHTLAQIAIQNDAPETEKATYLNLYKQILQELGLHSNLDFQQRSSLGQCILTEIMKVLPI
ncbi:MAG: hypothetical protein AAF702_24705 [Chloroflexota bacterium]